MNAGYLLLTDLATPDETDMRVLVSSIVAFGNDSRRRNNDFVHHFGYLDLVGGHTKLVCESAEEIQELIIEYYAFVEGEAQAAAEAQAEADRAYEETVSKALGLDGLSVQLDLG